MLSHKDLEFSNLKSQEIHVKASENMGIHSDALTFSWNNSTPMTAQNLFTLEFVALTDGTLSEMVEIGSMITKAEMYREDSFDTYQIELEFDLDENLAIQLFQNDPNPFSDKTSIKFVLPESADINLSIYHVNGSLIKSIKGSYPAGQHNITLDRKELNMSGILYYHLRVGDYTNDTYRVVVID